MKTVRAIAELALIAVLSFGFCAAFFLVGYTLAALS